MLLNVLTLTPYVAIAASLFLACTVVAVCWQVAKPPRRSGFGISTDRRRVTYRGAVKATRPDQLQEAA